jgi:UDP-N-acetylglucosamine:LPS N-acetylglucosamine transferase
MNDPPREGSATAETGSCQPLRICLLGLGGGGFHWEVQRIIKAVRRPLELILIYAGPNGGIVYWDSKDSVRSSYIVRSPALTGDGPISKVIGVARNLVMATNILAKERPDAILAVGTAQAIPFGIAARMVGVPLWYVESITRARRPSKTAQIVHRFRLSTKFYYYWRDLSKELRGGYCLEKDRQ